MDWDRGVAFYCVDWYSGLLVRLVLGLLLVCFLSTTTNRWRYWPVYIARHVLESEEP